MNLPLPDGALLLFVFLFIVLNAVALPAWIVGISTGMEVKLQQASFC